MYRFPRRPFDGRRFITRTQGFEVIEVNEDNVTLLGKCKSLCFSFDVFKRFFAAANLVGMATVNVYYFLEFPHRHNCFKVQRDGEK